MKAGDFKRFLEQIGQLTKRQRQMLAAMLQPQESLGQVTELIETAVAPTITCPRCGAAKPHRHGVVDGLQRFRCVTCGRTFNSLTSTPLSRLRKKPRWLDYLDCILGSTTVRAAARLVGVDKNTSFRWRHRFLDITKHDRQGRLEGIAEADELYLLESEKGARKMNRPARKRGGAATKRGTSDEQVCVLVARDRTGKTFDFVTGRGPVSKRQLHQCLPPILANDVLLVSDANAAYRYFAREAGISHQSVNLRAGERVRGAIHVQNVNAYHSRFREWLHRFHGVATHYLPNYLGWRWAIDCSRVNSPDALLRSALGVFHT